MNLPPEILLLIADHLASDTAALSATARTCKAAHAVLSPLLWRNLTLDQHQLIALLSAGHPSHLFRHVRCLTRKGLDQDFALHDHLPVQTSTSVVPVFPNATTLRFDEYVVLSPAGYASLPKLLLCERLINHTRVHSWRLAPLPLLWSDSLRVIELYCHSWTVHFLAPGIHHVLHMDRLAQPFCSAPARTVQVHDAQHADIDPQLPLPSSEAYRRELESTVQWLVHAVRAVAAQEEEGKMTTWKLRIKRAGNKEVSWARQRLGEMMLDQGLGEGRVQQDEQTGRISLTGIGMGIDTETYSEHRA